MFPPMLCPITISRLSFAVFAAAAHSKLFCTSATIGPLFGCSRELRYTNTSPTNSDTR